MRRSLTSVIAALLLAGCANSSAVRSSNLTSTTPDSSTSCHEVIPECHVGRLPDKVLTGDEVDGALSSTDGFDVTRLISFDDALKLGWNEDGRTDAKNVQVVLGSGDADKLHWGTGVNLYYAIIWNDVCDTPSGPIGAPHPSLICGLTAGSVFDAHTGEFIVSGISS